MFFFFACVLHKPDQDFSFYPSLLSSCLLALKASSSNSLKKSKKKKKHKHKDRDVRHKNPLVHAETVTGHQRFSPLLSVHRGTAMTMITVWYPAGSVAVLKWLFTHLHDAPPSACDLWSSSFSRCQSSRLSDESRVSRSSRLDLTVCVLILVAAQWLSKIIFNFSFNLRDSENHNFIRKI